MAWWGLRGLGWSDFVHSFQLPALLNNPPKVILFHLGGNDVTKHSLKYLFKSIQEGMEYAKSAFPDTHFIWIEILQRFNWGASIKENIACEKKRKRVNQLGRKLVRVLSPNTAQNIVRVDIDIKTPGFYRPDGVHLSDVGLDMYIDSIRETLIKVL